MKGHGRYLLGTYTLAGTVNEQKVKGFPEEIGGQAGREGHLGRMESLRFCGFWQFNR